MDSIVYSKYHAILYAVKILKLDEKQLNPFNVSPLFSAFSLVEIKKIHERLRKNYKKT